MAEILFVTWDGGGNLPPTLGIASELRARGHHVRFLGHPAQSPALAAADVEVWSSQHARAFSSGERHTPLSMMAAFGDRGMGRDLLAAIEDRPADLVVIDCLMFGAMDTARRAGLRYAVLEHFYDGYYENGCLRGPLGLSLRLRRLAPRLALGSARARLVTTLPELDQPVRSTSASLVWTGPVVDHAPVEPDRDADPMVLISLSTFAFAGMTDCLQRLVDAVASIGTRAVVTTGPVVDPTDIHAPPGIEVHRFVPHVELLPAASLLVGHGGHGTTMQALAHDLPVLVMPMDRLTDQPLVGRSIENAGAGRVVPKEAAVAELVPAIAALLADGPHRHAAARLGEIIRSRPGARLAADALESALQH